LPQPVAERRGREAAVLVPMDDRDRTESVLDLPRRSPDAGLGPAPAMLELLTHKVALY
jgi:hypothetical protein